MVIFHSYVKLPEGNSTIPFTWSQHNSNDKHPFLVAPHVDAASHHPAETRVLQPSGTALQWRRRCAIDLLGIGSKPPRRKFLHRYSWKCRYVIDIIKKKHIELHRMYHNASEK
jgi:hypothetical protein